MRCFGFALLNFKMINGKSSRGVSVKTLELYAIVFLCRVLSITRHQGYLPFDKTGDWFYHFVEIISFLAVCCAIYILFGPLRSTYERKYDKFGNLNVPDYLGVVYLLGPCVLLAIVFHPSLNNELFSDICWTLSMYLESVAMPPQLYMFQKQANDEGSIVESLTSHMVFALGFSRVFELIFWVTSFTELQHYSGSRIAGYLVLIAQICHVGIMGDFFYYYFRSVSQGTPMELPTTYSGVV
ncbi:KdelR [Symbiodinium microadriaticum]|nr:KdelR [Symbiodinium microadriaticum]